MKKITYNGEEISDNFIILKGEVIATGINKIKKGEIINTLANIPFYITLVTLSKKAKSRINHFPLVEYEISQMPDGFCNFTFLNGAVVKVRKTHLEEFYALHWPYIIQGKDAQTGDIDGLIVETIGFRGDKKNVNQIQLFK